MASSSSDPLGHDDAQDNDAAVDDGWPTVDDWVPNPIDDEALESLEDSANSIATFNLTARSDAAAGNDTDFWNGHLQPRMNHLRETLSEQLASLIADSPHKKDKEEIRQVLNEYPNDVSFVSSYHTFVGQLFPSPTPSRAAAIELLYNGVGFKVEVMKGSQADETALKSLGNGILSQVQYLQFDLHGNHFQFMEKDDGEQLQTWQRIMGPVLDVLSYHKLHLMIDYTFCDTTEFGSVLDILEGLPQMKDYSLNFIPNKSRLWNMRIKQTVRKIRMRGKDSIQEKSPKFHNYSLLPKELRMLVLSFTDLVPTIRPSKRSSSGPENSEEIGKREFQHPKWYFVNGYWRDGKSCCRKCTWALLDYYCCCNFETCRASTTCACTDDAYSLLAVSRHFRADALEVLFSNHVYIHSRYGAQFLDNLQDFLDWVPTITNIHLTKSIQIEFDADSVRAWMADERKTLAVKLNYCLRTLVEHCGPLTVITLDLASLRDPWDPWPGIGVNDLRGFETDLCQIVESIFLSYHGRCGIYIYWSKLNEVWRSAQRPGPHEALYDGADGLLQVEWHKNQWLINSEDFFEHYGRLVTRN